MMTDSEFSRLVAFVKNGYGIDLAKKRELVESRLSLHISKLGCASYTKYLDSVTRGPEGAECRAMIDRLSTNHTYFFREMDAIRDFIDRAVPEILARPAGEIRIWCAAASSGQECWTLAMELGACLQLRVPLANYSILATDVSERALARGEKGIYPLAELEKIPVRFSRSCTRRVDGEHFEIAPELRPHVEWQRLNLMEPFSFTRAFDAVFCRNVMFYFDNNTRAALLPKLGSSLCPGGRLYVGVTETIDRERRYFDYLAPSIYRKKGASK